jgi:hypothetical protein
MARNEDQEQNKGHEDTSNSGQFSTLRPAKRRSEQKFSRRQR